MPDSEDKDAVVIKYEKADHLLQAAMELKDAQKRASSVDDKAYTRLRNETVWRMLMMGYTRRQIIERLGILESEYNKSMEYLICNEKPSTEDVDRERKLAHDRYLAIYRKLHDEYDEVEKPGDIALIAREMRATIKEIGDIYSIKMPEKIEIEANINLRAKADDTIKMLMAKMSKKPAIEEKVIEAQVVEETEQKDDSRPE